MNSTALTQTSQRLRIVHQRHWRIVTDLHV
jgi:hypothetical protein